MTPSVHTAGRRKPEGYDPQRTKRALVDAALARFEKDGFDRTTLQDIVDDAGLTKGAFYYHFASKEEVLWQIQDEYLDKQIEAASGILSQDADPTAQLRELIALSLISTADYRSHVAIFHQERRHLTGERLEAIVAKRNELEGYFRDAVRRGMSQGLFLPELNERVVTFAIIGMCAWAFQWYRPGGSMSIADVAEQFCDLVLDGLLA